MKKEYFHISTIISITVLCYWNSLYGNFVFDDTEAIVKNKDVLNETPLINIWYNDFWGTPLIYNNSHRSYRPLTVLSFRLNNYMTTPPLPNAFNYHFVNLILYCFICILTYFIFKILFQLCCIRKRKDIHNNAAFKASLLFTLHPIHVEAVCATVGRADLLSAFCFWLVLLLYHQCISTTNTSLFLKITYWLLCLILSAFALLAKETGITVIGVCCFYDIIYNKVYINDIFTYIIRKKQDSKNVFKKIILRQFILISFGLILLYLRYRVMEFKNPIFQVVDNPASFSDSIVTRVLTYSYIYILNGILLLWPHWLCFDWSMGCVPLITTIWDVRAIYVILFWILIMFLISKLKYFIINERLIIISLSIIVLPFLPASNIMFRVGFVIAERVLFIPSAGFCILIVLGMEKLYLFQKIKNGINISFILLIICFLLKTMHRSQEWLTEDILFRSALSVCPNNAKVHYNIAKIAVDKGDIKHAEEEYRMALTLHPDYDQAMNNLANILKDTKRLEEAEYLLRKAVDIRQNFPAAWMNLGIVLSNRKQYKEAETCYLKALSYRTKYPDCFYNLGNLYMETKQSKKAIAAWHKAIELKPKHVMAWSNLLVHLDNINLIEIAITEGMKAINILPDEPGLHFTLANSLGKVQRWTQAEKHFLKAIQLNPTNALYYSNLGVLYHRWNKMDEAENYYKNALRLDPSLKSAKDNLENLLRKK